MALAQLNPYLAKKPDAFKTHLEAGFGPVTGSPAAVDGHSAASAWVAPTFRAPFSLAEQAERLPIVQLGPIELRRGQHLAMLAAAGHDGIT